MFNGLLILKSEEGEISNLCGKFACWKTRPYNEIPFIGRYNPGTYLVYRCFSQG
jgi:hypothetical protein